MTLRRAFLSALLFTAGTSFLHAWLNLGLFARPPAGAEKPLRVGFLPVT